MNTYTKAIPRQIGVGLLEVMIAVAVLSIALLSLGGLHAMIIKAGSAAKVKGIATSLAADKLDHMRSFGAAGSGFDFTNILTYISGDPNELPVPENVNFYRTWSVADLFLCAQNAVPSLTNSCAKTIPDLKMVTISVYWDNPEDGSTVALTGTPENDATLCATAGPDACLSVTLKSTISWVSPDLAAQGLQAAPSSGPEKIRNPSHDSSDEDITHDLGEVLKRVSQPVPDTNRGANDTSYNTITTFHEEYFDQNDRLIGENEFYTVNCYCNEMGAPANDSDYPFGLDPTILKNNKYVAGNVNKSKRRGARATGGQFNDQPASCAICCKDHHDISSASNEYDPFRPSSDFISGGDHNHYSATASAQNFTDATKANVNNARYAEACRMAWVDGRLRVLQDWRLENLVMLPPNFFNESDNIGLYTDYVTAYVTEFVKAISTGYPDPDSLPRRSTILATSSVSNAMQALPIDYSTSTSPEQMQVRGLYIDYMDIDLINKLKCKISLSSDLLEGGDVGGSDPTCSEYGITATGSYLYLIPFHDVNLTKLAQWNSSNGANISVTSDSLLDQNESTFSRGKITRISDNSRACISARINTSNTGLTVSESIDPEDQSYKLTDTSESVNPITVKMPVTYGTSTAADPCTIALAPQITGTVSTTSGGTGGLQPADVYIRITNTAGTTEYCTFAVNSNGTYDSNIACATALQGVSDVKMYIWHYTFRTGSTTYDNCVYSSALPAGTLAYSEGQRYTGNPTITGFNPAWEHSIVPFSGLTDGSTTVFNFQINADSSSSTQCSVSN